MGKRTWTLVAALLLAPGLGLTAWGAPFQPTSGTHAFDHTLAAAQVFAAEPGILIDDARTPARVYLFAPAASSQLWASDDTAQSFQMLARTAGGSGDADAALDATGRLYVSDLLRNTPTLHSTIPVSTSLDAGASFARIREVAPDAPEGTIAWDREWLAARGDGEVLVTARSGGLVAAWRSTDAARSFDGPFEVATDATKTGPVRVDATGYRFAYTTADEVRLASSPDGREWTTARIGHLTGRPLIFPSLDVDDAGNLHAAWASSPTHNPSIMGLPSLPVAGSVRYAASADGGATWTTPQVVSDPNRTAVYAWVSAGAAGRANVAFVTADDYVTADAAPPTTRWGVEMAQTLDAFGTAAWTRSVIVDEFHVGSICTQGAQCPGPQAQAGVGNAPTPGDRRHLDFFALDTLPDGRAILAYTRDRPMVGGAVFDHVYSWVDLMVAVQTDGARLR